jgi:hypothetical protein
MATVPALSEVTVPGRLVPLMPAAYGMRLARRVG